MNLSLLSALVLSSDGGEGGEGGEFDLIGGVPAHPLLVHFAVVLLPLSALGLLVILFVPKLRRSLGWLVMLGLAAAAGASLLAKETGEALAELVGLPQRHADLGDKLPVFAALLFIVALAWYLLAMNADRRKAKAAAATAATTSAETSSASASASSSTPAPDAPAATGGRSPLTLVLGAIAGLLALLNIYWVIQVGHSGAEAVWAGRLPASGSAAAAPSTAPSDSASTGASASSSASASSTSAITMADVAKHNSQADCWSVVSKDVYNLTAWIAQHPGGPSPIESMCGVDATSAFTNQHGGQGRPEQELASFKIGVLG